MLMKLNIFLFFVIAIVISFSCGVYYSNSVKSELNLEKKITQTEGENKTFDDKPTTPKSEVVKTTEPESEEVLDEVVETENKNTTTESRFSEPTELKYGINSANGITLTWYVKNLSGKTINYYTVKISTFNAVGDPSYDRHSGDSTFSLRYVGPVEPGEELGVYKLFSYQGALETIIIDEVDLEYEDGTKETVIYGHSTSDDSGFDN